MSRDIGEFREKKREIQSEMRVHSSSLRTWRMWAIEEAMKRLLVKSIHWELVTHLKRPA